MIKFLHRMRSRRGFTVAELIVVVAIIAVVATMLLPTFDTRKSNIDKAISASHDMYNVMQSIFTKYSLYEGPLNLTLKSEETPTATSYIHFFKKVGGNYPCKAGATSFPDMPETCELFIEVDAKGGIINSVNVGNTFEDLLKRGDNVKDSSLGRQLKNDLETRISAYDGYYLVKVRYEAVAPTPPETTTDEVNTVRICFAAFSEKQFPQCTGSWSEYASKNLLFNWTGSYTTAKRIVGVFSPYVANAEGEDRSLGQRGTVLG
ncbi:MAG: prepilin-type N-terminal cleavage/methylation domain-containing protein [Oscillospiraceae bacterium]|nr:prepilin-type N-terminal cleavage/methylation domain-containing protein [Oscillospiraceae bacterium]